VAAGRLSSRQIGIHYANCQTEMRSQAAGKVAVMLTFYNIRSCCHPAR
jgi:hypothetical protein